MLFLFGLHFKLQASFFALKLQRKKEKKIIATTHNFPSRSFYRRRCGSYGDRGCQCRRRRRIFGGRRQRWEETQEEQMPRMPQESRTHRLVIFCLSGSDSCSVLTAGLVFFFFLFQFFPCSPYRGVHLFFEITNSKLFSSRFLSESAGTFAHSTGGYRVPNYSK